MTTLQPKFDDQRFANDYTLVNWVGVHADTGVFACTRCFKFGCI